MPNPTRVRDRTRAPSTAFPAELADPSTSGPQHRFTCEPIDSLKPAGRQIRKHPKRQVEILIRNIRRFGVVVPILITPEREIIDGHLVWEACKKLGHKAVPTTLIGNLSPAEIKALRISINAIAAMGEWDDPALAAELDFVCKIDPLLISFTALPTARIDQLLLTGLEKKDADGDDDIVPPVSERWVSRRGDLFTCAQHRFGCGDATDPEDLAKVMGSRTAQMLFSDFPYGVSIEAISSTHGEFAAGSKITPAEARELFDRALAGSLPFVQDGSATFLFIDHRSMAPLTDAAIAAGLRHLCTAVWDKTAGSRGGLYKHQVEFVLIMAKGASLRTNNVQTRLTLSRPVGVEPADVATSGAEGRCRRVDRLLAARRHASAGGYTGSDVSRHLEVERHSSSEKIEPYRAITGDQSAPNCAHHHSFSKSFKRLRLLSIEGPEERVCCTNVVHNRPSGDGSTGCLGKAFVHAEVADVIDEETYVQLLDTEKMVINTLADTGTINITSASLLLASDWRTAKTTLDALVEKGIIERKPGKDRDRFRPYYLKGRPH